MFLFCALGLGSARSTCRELWWMGSIFHRLPRGLTSRIWLTDVVFSLQYLSPFAGLISCDEVLLVWWLLFLPCIDLCCMVG